MPKFAANLHYLFTEVPFLERFATAKRCGFRAVEFQVPYDWPADQLAQLLQQHQLTMVLMDTPVGDWDGGDRGLAAVPGREQEFRDSLEPAIAYARALRCPTIHVMSGVLRDETQRERAEQTYVDNLSFAAQQFAPHGITAVIEPINKMFGVVQDGPSYTTQGMHGYFLNHSWQARRYIEAINHANLRLHLDFYHMQVTEGHLDRSVRENIHLLQHLQLAGVPGRHEPSVGEINYPHLFALIDALGYDGWIGCEYRPAGRTEAGLTWARAYGIADYQ